ncbi:hypothetical protein J2T47_002655 [Pseudomonas nitroreducens]|nr:hypothetical protein [Pseudomonas nitroreducens]
MLKKSAAKLLAIALDDSAPFTGIHDDGLAALKQKLEG